jgi:hypothetical protein
MLPMIAHNLLQSIMLLANAVRLLADKAITGMTVNTARMLTAVEHNPMLVTGAESGARVRLRRPDCQAGIRRRAADQGSGAGKNRPQRRRARATTRPTPDDRGRDAEGMMA